MYMSVDTVKNYELSTTTVSDIDKCENELDGTYKLSDETKNQTSLFRLLTKSDWRLQTFGLNA